MSDYQKRCGNCRYRKWSELFRSDVCHNPDSGRHGTRVFIETYCRQWQGREEEKP